MISRDIKAFILRALLAAAGEPLTEETLKGAVFTRYSRVGLTDGDLRQWIREVESAGLIAGTNDDILGLVWSLTPKGKIKAQQL
jgi:hypothetical protein